MFRLFLAEHFFCIYLQSVTLNTNVMKKLILSLLLIPLVVLTSCKSKEDPAPAPEPEPVVPTLQVDNTVAILSFIKAAEH